MSRRETSRKKMEARIEEAEGYLKILRARASLAGARMQEEFEQRKRELDSFVRTARRRLEGPGHRAAEAGQELWGDLEQRWQGVRGVLDAFIARTGQSDPGEEDGVHDGERSDDRDDLEDA